MRALSAFTVFNDLDTLRLDLLVDFLVLPDRGKDDKCMTRIVELDLYIFSLLSVLLDTSKVDSGILGVLVDRSALCRLDTDIFALLESDYQKHGAQPASVAQLCCYVLYYAVSYGCNIKLI